MRTRAVLSHTAQAVAEGALIALLVVGLAAGTTFAKGSGGGASTGGGGHHGGGGTTGGAGSLALVMVIDNNGNGAPNYADTITWNVTTSDAYPTVNVTCTQNGSLVYSAGAGFYPSYPWPGSQKMPLYSPSWTGGAASCTAVLSGTAGTMATYAFAVGA